MDWNLFFLLLLSTIAARLYLSGPKSGPALMLAFHDEEFLAHQTEEFFCDLWSGRGEGRAVSMNRSERDTCLSVLSDTPEIHGTGHAASSGTLPRASRRTVKRSFARAQRRLLQTGFCIYRGHVHTQPPMAPAVHSSSKRNGPRPSQAKGPRLSCMTWNCGGLSTESYNELLTWLSLHRIDICFIQGTRWGIAEPWESHGFALIPTPNQAGAHDGLLTVVRSQFCSSASISHVTVLEGRLQHIRCNLGTITLDLVNCYQHPNNPARFRPDPLQARLNFWHAWEDLLNKLPFRNLLVVAGDFNCTLGSTTRRHVPDAQFPDCDSFKAVVDRFSLASVRVHDSYPSYIGPAGESNIDYIFARRPQLDQMSRQAQCLRCFPLNQHREYPDHNPIVTTIPLSWKAWYSKPPMMRSHLSHATVQRLRQDWETCSPQWQIFETQIGDQLRQAAQNRTPPHLVTNKVVHACNEHFRKTPVKSEPAWCHPRTRSLVALKWRHLHLVRNSQHLRQSMQSQVFRAWSHFAKFHLLRTRLRKHCQDLRKSKVQRVIQEATQAAVRHDSRRLYMAIRQLTPKQPRRQIRFRNTGTAQSPQEELNTLVSHFEAIFRATSSEFPPTEALIMPFTQDDLEHELRATKSLKAVAPGTMPPVLIKHFASGLAKWLYRYLEDAWQYDRPVIPATWKKAVLTLLAKRPVHCPNDLRPIALTCGLGKAVLGTLIKTTRAYVADNLAAFPLFAYTERRGVFEALCYAFDHCHQVRAACLQARPSYWKKQAGHSKPVLIGGMMLSLDLSQAFDRLPRSCLYEGLVTCGCPSTLALLLVNWLKDAKYDLNHRGLTAEIVTTCGVRQGCKGSPLEWNVFMTVILRALCQVFRTPLPQLIHKLICFADDLLLRWTINTCDHAFQALCEVGQTLDILEQHQLMFNPKKTVMIVRLEGSRAARFNKQHIVKTREGLFIRIPRQQGETLLPIVHSHVYLGCKLSYHWFEKLTLAHRLQIGKAAFQRLRPWLAKRHSVNTSTRARVWQSCIYSSYTHGLAAAGLTQEGLHKLVTRCNADLRTLGQFPGHITHECNGDLFRRIGIDDPACLVKEQWSRLFSRLEHQQEALRPTDFLRTLPIHATRTRVMSVFVHTQVHRLALQLSCPYCTQLFDDMTQLNRHMVVTHKITRTLEMFEPIRDALQGQPQCRHCLFQFQDWRGLKRHIVKGGCPMFDPDLEHQVPPADQLIFRDYACADAWAALTEHADHVTILREHCVLCGQYFFSGKALLEHLNHAHYEMWLESKHLAPMIMDALRDTKPCQACGKSLVKAHACHVIRQMAIVRALHQSDRLAEDVAKGKPVAPMPPKPDQTWQLPDSGQRIRSSPTTAQSFRSIHAFHPGRDSADGTSTCAHCQSVQGSHFALRRRIESGCCKAFNSNRPLGTHIPQTWPELMDLARNGEIQQILSKSAYVQALRTVCALCGRHCVKPGSLHQHHLQDHADLVHAAAERRRNMQNEATAAGRPCYCGNKIVRKGHQCVVFNQLALLQVISKDATDAEQVDKDLMFPLTRSQVASQPDAELDAYWSKFDFRSSLNIQCQLCQLSLQQDEIESHLWTTHASLGASALDLYPSCVSPRLDCCRHCLESAGVVEYCPAALQLAFVRASSRPEPSPHVHGHLRDHRRRHDGSDARCTWGNLHKFFQVQSKEGATRGTFTGSLGSTRTPPESYEPPHGSEFTARITTPGSGLHGPVPDVLSDEPTRDPSIDPQPHNLLEEGNGAEQSQEAAAGGSIPIGLSDGARQDAGHRQAVPVKPGMGPSCEEPTHNLGGQVALSTVVQRLQMPQTDQQTCNRHGQDAEDAGGSGRGSPGGSPYPAVQIPEEHLHRDQTSADLPVLAPPLHPREQPLGDSQPSLSQLDMARHSGQSETTQPEREPLGHFISQILEAGCQNVKWPIQQEEVKGTLLALRLINPDNRCFIHATILAFFWGFLHLQHGKRSDLGGAPRLLMDMCTRSSLWVDVCDLECWGDWLEPWLDGRQHDAHEFLKAYLAYVQPPALSGSWVRKMQMNNQVQVMDSGSACLPPSLVTSDITAEKVTLQSLIDEWQSYMGMITAFEKDSPLICFQIDRFCRLDQGRVIKAAWHLELTEVEVLVSAESHNLRTEAFSYLPISGIVHRGQDQQGHLQCVARHTTGWAVFDDGIESQVHPTLKPPRMADWICVWLIRTPRCRTVTPSFYVRGHASKVHRLVQFLDSRSWQSLEAEEDLTRYFAARCGACAQLFLDCQSLLKHIFLRRSSSRWLFKRSTNLIGLDFRGVETPCLLCGALPQLGGPLRNIPTHTCPAILNYLMAKDFHEQELQRHGPIYGTVRTRDSLSADMEEESPRGLGEWLNLGPQ